MSAPSRIYIFPALDLLKASALLMVISYHAKEALLPGGFLAVSIFFVISGFLSTQSLERTLAQATFTDHVSWLLKRFQQLLIPAVILIASTLILGGIFAPDLLWKMRVDSFWAATGTLNLHHILQQVSYFDAGGIPSAYTHLWYLGVLLQLTATLWVILLLCRKLSCAKQVKMGILGVLAVLSMLDMFLLRGFQLEGLTRIYYAPDARAFEFLAGSILGIYLDHTTLRTLRLRFSPKTFLQTPYTMFELIVYRIIRWTPAVILGSILALLVCMHVILPTYEWIYPFGIGVVVLLSGILVTLTTLKSQTLAMRILTNQAVSWISRHSLLLYLWHYPLVVYITYWYLGSTPPLFSWLVMAILLLLLAKTTHMLASSTPSLGWIRHSIEARSLRLTNHREILGGILLISVFVIGLYNVLQIGANPLEALKQMQADTPSRGVLVDHEVLRQKSPSFAQAHDYIASKRIILDDQGASHATKIILIGDSVAQGARDEFLKLFPNAYVDTKIGRQLTTGGDLLHAALNSGYDASRVIFALGNNGVAHEPQVRQLVESAGQREVYLLTLRLPQGLQDMNNALFRRIADEYPHVHLIDWYAESEGHREWFWNDGCHLRPEGAKAWTELIKRSLVNA